MEVGFNTHHGREEGKYGRVEDLEDSRVYRKNKKKIGVILLQTKYDRRSTGENEAKKGEGKKENGTLYTFVPKCYLMVRSVLSV